MLHLSCHRAKGFRTGRLTRRSSFLSWHPFLSLSLDTHTRSTPNGRRHSSFPSQSAAMVRISVLNDALNSIVNAERKGKRQVLIRPSSKVVIKFLSVMQKHGEYSFFLWMGYGAKQRWRWEQQRRPSGFITSGRLATATTVVHL